MRDYRKTAKHKSYLREYNQRPSVRKAKADYEVSEIGKQRKREYELRPEIAARIKKMKRKHKLRKYGLTLEQFDSEIKKRNGKCDGCGNDIKGKVCIDHCHKTNSFRGVLCHRCNVTLGLFDDSAVLLRKLAEYADGFVLFSHYVGGN